MNIKTLLNLSIFIAITMCGYKESVAMNAPVSFARHTAIALFSYSPLWMQECVNHGNAKSRQNDSAMDIANRLLAASLAIPIAATNIIAPTIEKVIKNNIVPTKLSRALLINSLLLAGVPTFSLYKDIVLYKYEQNKNLS